MEKIFRIGQKLEPKTTSQKDGSKVRLSNGHLWIESDLAERIFQGKRQSLAVYYDNMKSVLLACEDDKSFKSVHDCIMLMIKDKNIRGDKAISIQEFLADHDLDKSDRDLQYSYVDGLNMIQIKLA